MNSELQAGAARRIINPRPGVMLSGYIRKKGNTGIHDDLTATALVLKDGKTMIAIVALDLVGIHEDTVDRVRAAVAPIQPVLCCSHTHSGPATYAGKSSPKKVLEYVDSLVGAITSAINEAATRLIPVDVEYYTGKASIGKNRRERMPDGHIENGTNPDGPVDRSLRVLGLVDKEKKRVATLINLACHGTVLGPGNLLVSADWIGVMRARVEKDLGGLAMFVQGAAGDINPSWGFSPDRAYDELKALDMMSCLGSSVAESVLAATRAGAERLEGTPLRLDRVEVWLSTEAPSTTPTPPKTYRKPLLDAAKMPGWMSFMVDPILDKQFPWKIRIENKGGFWSIPLRVATVRIGDVLIATLGGELFTEIGQSIKAASPSKHTIVASVTDGFIVYIPTSTVHDEGGYEVDAWCVLKLPARFSRGVEGIVKKTAIDGLERVWSG